MTLDNRFSTKEQNVLQLKQNDKISELCRLLNSLSMILFIYIDASY